MIHILLYKSINLLIRLSLNNSCQSSLILICLRRWKNTFYKELEGDTIRWCIINDSECMLLTTAAGHHNSDAPNISVLFILSTKLWPSICGSFGVSQNYPHFDFLALVHICHAFTIEQPHKQDQCILLFCLTSVGMFYPEECSSTPCPCKLRHACLTPKNLSFGL